MQLWGFDGSEFILIGSVVVVWCCFTIEQFSGTGKVLHCKRGVQVNAFKKAENSEVVNFRATYGISYALTAGYLFLFAFHIVLKLMTTKSIMFV